MSTTNPHDYITAHLLTTTSLPVSSTWLSSLLSSSSTSVPLTALTQTALFRVLASDFTGSLSTSNRASLLPPDVSDPAVKERRIAGPVPVQVLDIDDIGTSLWSQVEAIERVERGEAVRGRQIVRTVNVGDDDNNNTGDGNGVNSSNTNNSRLGEASRGPHRLVLQDAAGTRVVAIELRPVEGVAIGKLPIGAKMVLRNATVARGMVLLGPECVTLLGGKIEAMDRAWREGRKARLLARIEQMERERAQRGGDEDVTMEE
ncbi:hypothetical protein M432DRAFT_611367 [Thermoascus aurantiacus ATCC 26904]